jgi:hypothetical protein
MSEAVLNTTYLPKHYCWNGEAIQIAVDQRVKMLAFLHAHPYLRVFSGLRAKDQGGDHRCGAALDMVPLTVDAHGKAATFAAHADAEEMRKRGEVAYVEPMADTWRPGNHHLHVSFRRCA